MATITNSSPQYSHEETKCLTNSKSINQRTILSLPQVPWIRPRTPLIKEKKKKKQKSSSLDEILRFKNEKHQVKLKLRESQSQLEAIKRSLLKTKIDIESLQKEQQNIQNALSLSANSDSESREEILELSSAQLQNQNKLILLIGIEEKLLNDLDKAQRELSEANVQTQAFEILHEGINDVFQKYEQKSFENTQQRYQREKSRLHNAKIMHKKEHNKWKMMIKQYQEEKIQANENEAINKITFKDSLKRIRKHMLKTSLKLKQAKIEQENLQEMKNSRLFSSLTYLKKEIDNQKDVLWAKAQQRIKKLEKQRLAGIKRHKELIELGQNPYLLEKLEELTKKELEKEDLLLQHQKRVVDKLTKEFEQEEMLKIKSIIHKKKWDKFWSEKVKEKKKLASMKLKQFFADDSEISEDSKMKRVCNQKSSTLSSEEPTSNDLFNFEVLKFDSDTRNVKMILKKRRSLSPIELVGKPSPIQQQPQPPPPPPPRESLKANSSAKAAEVKAGIGTEEETNNESQEIEHLSEVVMQVVKEEKVHGRRTKHKKHQKVVNESNEIEAEEDSWETVRESVFRPGGLGGSSVQVEFSKEIKPPSSHVNVDALQNVSVVSDAGGAGDLVIQELDPKIDIQPKEKTSSFKWLPEKVVFKDFEIGKTYKKKVIVTNTTLKRLKYYFKQLIDNSQEFQNNVNPSNNNEAEALASKKHEITEVLKVNFERPSPISPGLSHEFYVIFHPNKDTQGDHYGLLEFESPNGPFDIQIMCLQKTFKPVLSTNEIRFHNTVVNSTNSLTVKLTNIGAKPGLISHILQPSLIEKKSRQIMSVDEFLEQQQNQPILHELHDEVETPKEPPPTPTSPVDERHRKKKPPAPHQPEVASSVIVDHHDHNQKLKLPQTPTDGQHNSKHDRKVKRSKLKVADHTPSSAIVPPPTVESKKQLDDLTNEANKWLHEIFTSVTEDTFVAYVAECKRWLKPDETVHLKIHFHPQFVGDFISTSDIISEDQNVPPIKLHMEGIAMEYPANASPLNTDFKTCVIGFNYQQPIKISNTSKFAGKVYGVVPKQLRHFVEILPNEAQLFPSNSVSLSVKFKPRPAFLNIPDLKFYYDSATKIVDFPVYFCLEYPFTIPSPIVCTFQCVLTQPKLQISPEEINFGKCSSTETVRGKISITNTSLLPEQIGFVEVPQAITIQPNYGFSTLLPNETKIFEVLLSPTPQMQGTEHNFQFKIQSLRLEEHTIKVTAFVISQILYIAHSRIYFPVTCCASSVSAITQIFSTAAPKKSRGIMTSLGGSGISRFEFQIPSNVPVEIRPRVGFVEPGKSVKIAVCYHANVTAEEVRLYYNKQLKKKFEENKERLRLELRKINSLILKKEKEEEKLESNESINKSKTKTTKKNSVGLLKSDSKEEKSNSKIKLSLSKKKKKDLEEVKEAEEEKGSKSSEERKKKIKKSKNRNRKSIEKHDEVLNKITDKEAQEGKVEDEAKEKKKKKSSNNKIESREEEETAEDEGEGEEEEEDLDQDDRNEKNKVPAVSSPVKKKGKKSLAADAEARKESSAKPKEGRKSRIKSKAQKPSSDQKILLEESKVQAQKALEEEEEASKSTILVLDDGTTIRVPKTMSGLLKRKELVKKAIETPFNQPDLSSTTSALSDPLEFAKAKRDLMKNLRTKSTNYTIPCLVKDRMTLAEEVIMLSINCPIQTPDLIVLDDDSNIIDFGEVCIHTKCIKNINLFNMSSTNLTIKMDIINPFGPFVRINALRKILRDHVLNLRFKFSPDKPEFYEETVTIIGGESHLMLTLKGKAVLPEFNLKPDEASIFVGKVRLKTVKIYQFEIENKSKSTLEFHLETVEIGHYEGLIDAIPEKPPEIPVPSTQALLALPSPSTKKKRRHSSKVSKLKQEEGSIAARSKIDDAASHKKHDRPSTSSRRHSKPTTPIVPSTASKAPSTSVPPKFEGTFNIEGKELTFDELIDNLQEKQEDVFFHFPTNTISIEPGEKNKVIVYFIPIQPGRYICTFNVTLFGEVVQQYSLIGNGFEDVAAAARVPIKTESAMIKKK